MPANSAPNGKPPSQEQGENQPQGRSKRSNRGKRTARHQDYRHAPPAQNPQDPQDARTNPQAAVSLPMRPTASQWYPASQSQQYAAQAYPQPNNGSSANWAVQTCPQRQNEGYYHMQNPNPIPPPAPAPQQYTPQYPPYYYTTQQAYYYPYNPMAYNYNYNCCYYPPQAPPPPPPPPQPIVEPPKTPQISPKEDFEARKKGSKGEHPYDKMVWDIERNFVVMERLQGQRFDWEDEIPRST